MSFTQYILRIFVHVIKILSRFDHISLIYKSELYQSAEILTSYYICYTKLLKTVGSHLYMSYYRINIPTLIYSTIRHFNRQSIFQIKLGICYVYVFHKTRSLNTHLPFARWRIKDSLCVRYDAQR